MIVVSAVSAIYNIILNYYITVGVPGIIEAKRL